LELLQNASLFYEHCAELKRFYDRSVKVTEKAYREDIKATARYPSAKEGMLSRVQDIGD